MTYAATSAGLWVNRANQAWGASRQYNVGSSFETDSTTWHGRADQAWGASRVWSSGTSFESDVTTWQGRANNAWGTSRVWNSGESWEAAYNRVLPPASQVTISGSQVATTFGTTETTVMQLTVTLTGYWFAAYAMQMNDSTAIANTPCTLKFAGTGVSSANWQNALGSAQGDIGGCGVYGGGVLTSGQTISVTFSRNVAGTCTISSQSLMAIFVSNQAYPH